MAAVAHQSRLTLIRLMTFLTVDFTHVRAVRVGIHIFGHVSELLIVAVAGLALVFSNITFFALRPSVTVALD